MSMVHAFLSLPTTEEVVRKGASQNEANEAKAMNMVQPCRHAGGRLKIFGNRL